MTREQKVWYGRQFGASSDLEAIIECAYRLNLGAFRDFCAGIRRHG